MLSSGMLQVVSDLLAAFNRAISHLHTLRPENLKYHHVVLILDKFDELILKDA
jgi:hypothetical protein